MITRTTTLLRWQPLASGSRSATAVSRRSKSTHRTIQVQLTHDIEGLGQIGSVQSVNPGRMRNDLFPKGLARYVVKGAQLTMPLPRAAITSNAPTSSGSLEIDYGKIRSQISSLPTLAIPRRAVRGTSIFGSVTSTDLVQAFQVAHGLNLVAPHAVVTISGGKVKRLGEYTANVVMKDGEGVDIKFKVVAQE
ncbi:hypothetical protein M407DRAFT_241679 [Tulasnella calospora MUT 4182]|uniref:50S ribosomal protein L9, chloroplastic n=1 Tax=Tulasnella calospora MUT 4182 TaxID=1051891 RepID=A0A0C3MDA6_9AGAM|nr:hypothetical protein M407DRAFT_241679 [Tulasnella calospora MUT 4182]